MTASRPEALLLTRDLDLVRTASAVLPEVRIDWRTSFTTGLTGITPDTRILLVDADIGMPMAHLLAALFLDQRPGRMAVVVQPPGSPARASGDPRVQVLDQPLGERELAEALAEAEAFGRACDALEGLAREATSAPAVTAPLALVTATVTA